MPNPLSHTGQDSIPILHKLFQKLEEKGTLLSSFYEGSITLIPKPHKDITRKESYKPLYLMNMDVKAVYMRTKPQN